MTLPERILSQLAEIDPDRTRAVVKVTEAAAGINRGPLQSMEMVEMAPGKSLIVVGPNLALQKIPWLKLIEIAPTRFLLTIPSGTSIEALEVALRDLYHDPDLRINERDDAVLQEMLKLIGDQRRSRQMSKEEILIIHSDNSTGRDMAGQAASETRSASNRRAERLGGRRGKPGASLKTGENDAGFISTTSSSKTFRS